MDTMLKRLLSFAVALVMVLGLMPWSAVSVYATDEVSEETEAASFTCTNPNHDHTGETVTWTAWDGTSNLTATGHYYLEDSASKAGGLTMTGDIVIDLNGNTLTATAKSFRFYLSGANTNLTLQNGTVEFQSGLTMTNAGSFVSGANVTGLALYISGVTVNGNNCSTSANAGLINAQRSGNVVVIKDSAFRNFTATTAGYGGVINLYSGTATLENVVMENCTAKYGGAVAVRNGTSMTMSGNCQITNCGDNAVYVSDSTLTISGGTYDVDVTAYLAEGLIQDEKGTVVEAPEEHVCDENVVVEAVPATCTAPGTTAGTKCSVCGAWVTEPTEIAQLEHSYTVVQQTVAPSCTEDGYTVYKCATCDATEQRDPVTAIGEHTWNDGVVTAEPTCTVDGVRTYTCSVCSESYTEAVDALGHSFDENQTCTTCESVAVASIGEALYTSLEDAVAAANATEAADSITVLRDAVIASRLDITSEITITADTAVTISADDALDAHMIHVDGGALTLGSEAAKITLAAGTATRNIVNINDTTGTTVTNVHMAGNERSKHADTNNASGLNIASDTVTATNVTIANVPSRGIRVASGCTANLDNVSISDSGGHGILAVGTVNVYTALSIENAGANGITVDPNGTFVSRFENLSEQTYAIQIENVEQYGIRVRKGVLNITDVSINDASCGLSLAVAGANATVKNASITNAETAVETIADTTLTVENVSVDTCDRAKVSIAGTLSGEITYSAHTEVIDAAVAATCSATGLTEGKHCTVCGAVTVAQEVTPVADHSYAGEITTAATCTEKGVMTYTCSVCSESYTEDIAALGHSFGENQTCSVCGAVAVASIGEALYTSLEDAVAAANATEAADSITVLCDVEIASRLDITTEITITADTAVTISADNAMDAHMIHVDGGALTLGSEAAKITLAAGTLTRNIINIKNTTGTTVTNVHMEGDENSTAGNNVANGLNIDAGTVTAKNVTIANVKYRGIRVAADCTANLYNVSLSDIGGYGILATGTVNIYDALSITNTGANSINVANGGKVQSYFENVSADTYAIQIDTSADSGILVRNGVLNVTNVSINNAVYGLNLTASGANATVQNASITNAETAIATIAGTTLTVANVSADTCALSIAGTVNGEITYPAHSYDKDGVCTVCGKVIVKSWNIILSDSIGLNFALALDEDDEVQVTVDGEEVSCELTENGDDTYQVFIEVAAAQMTSEIQIAVNDQPLEKAYSVRAYADVILAGEYSDEVKALVSNMLAYGGAAQNYFEYNTNDLADDSITVEEVTVPSDNLTLTMTDTLDSIEYYGASLLMRSKTAVRFYFTAESVEGLTFTVDGTGYTPSSTGSLHYVEVDGINPQQLGNTLKMVVTDGTGSLTVSYGPMNYITRMYYRDETSATMKAVVKAMYGYYLAAVAYIESLTA